MRPLAALALLAVLAVPAAAGSGVAGPRDEALAFLADSGAGPGLAPYLVEAAAAAGLDPASWPAGRPALDGILFPAADAPLLAKLRPAHAWAIAGRPLDAVGGRDLRSEILAAHDGAQFGDPDLRNDDAFAILALRADGMPADDSRLRSAATGLAAEQEGGWGWREGGPPDADTTGIVLTALAAAGVAPDEEAAAGFLAGLERPGGGHAATAGDDGANCDSTVWALRGLAALGRPASRGAWPYLLGLQQPDGGFAYRDGMPSDPLCTAEAATLLGLAASGAVPAPSPGPRGAAAPAAWTALAAAALAGSRPTHKS